MIVHHLKAALTPALLCLALAGCATASLQPAPTTPEQAVKPTISTLPSIKPAQSSQAESAPQRLNELLTVWVAGYCQGWADVSGDSFERCFELTLQDTFSTYKQRTGVDLTAAAKEVIAK
ncbi:hypothetical protein DV532_28290 (plasmid) [Pseudomonas sp. Leaf58]|uniref:hypothetical protein n=1 Tax=Pseudomonas sp. Leaf58 TaxID=1736226 RepID=UPI0006FF35F8|nr:hypothetical protein [Pseudomonas sp. Leaf58]AYG48170.1 hypothetical protein DV532_28290 [Pseudomonas sp. Leaf58]KQN62279.1 hypothetical protein ASF02_08940 [Pseudomonas sp. Leaf58]